MLLIELGKRATHHVMPGNVLANRCPGGQKYCTKYGACNPVDNEGA